MRSKLILFLDLAAWFGVNPLRAQPAPDAQIQRGKYLVENVAMCADCHTPRDDKGQLDRTQWLQGNLLDFKPDHPMPFAAVTIPIAGPPGFTDEQAVKFLETGIDVSGKPPCGPCRSFDSTTPPPWRWWHICVR